MTTYQEYPSINARVKQGAEWLDSFSVDGKWAFEVNPDDLHLDSSNLHILTQIFHKDYNLLLRFMSLTWLEDHGFTLTLEESMDSERWEVLNELWWEEVLSRCQRSPEWVSKRLTSMDNDLDTKGESTEEDIDLE